jgi:AAA+ ATPase superfamily predicted ATPase
VAHGLFKYDVIISEEDICNYEEEASKLLDYVARGRYVKLFGRRNFGKTSLVKNLVASRWQDEDPARRVVVYCDLYHVMEMDDLNREITIALSDALSRKKSFIEHSVDLLKKLGDIQFSWEPPSSGDGGFGKLSLSPVGRPKAPLLFPEAIKAMDKIQKNGEYSFLLILDEFQEVAKIDKADALIRGALQSLEGNMAIIITGSKQHLLSQLFYHPKKPLYQWGDTIELTEIAYEKYHAYIAARLSQASKSISLEVAKNIQDMCCRVPEAINRLCDFLADGEGAGITTENAAAGMKDLVIASRSIYGETLSRFSSGERKILRYIAGSGHIAGYTSVELTQQTGVPPSSSRRIIEGLIDLGILYKDASDKIMIEDPFFKTYLKLFHPI